MKRITRAGTVSILAFLAACTTSDPDDRDADLIRQLSDTEIYNDTASVQLNADGTLTALITLPDAGETIAARGTWKIEDGKFCRNLTQAPEGVERQLCEWVQIRGRTVSFDGLEPDGRRPVEYRIR